MIFERWENRTDRKVSSRYNFLHPDVWKGGLRLGSRFCRVGGGISSVKSRSPSTVGKRLSPGVTPTPFSPPPPHPTLELPPPAHHAHKQVQSAQSPALQLGALRSGCLRAAACTQTSEPAARGLDQAA